MNDTQDQAIPAITRLSEGFCPRATHHKLSWDGNCRLCKTWWLLERYGDESHMRVEARWIQRTTNGSVVHEAGRTINTTLLGMTSTNAEDVLTYEVIQVRSQIAMIAASA